MPARDSLKSYRDKRDFARTPEPAEGGEVSEGGLRFVIQKHAARNLHYDFRLEMGGTLVSWAVPKGPSLDPKVKRMGVHVEDHPLAYANFEGNIPPRQYGAGDVIVWDRGRWEPLGDPVAGLKAGKLKFELFGEKLKGGWTLVRMHGRPQADAAAAPPDTQEPWLLIKEHDRYARPAGEFDVLIASPDSVLSGKPLPGEASSRGRSKDAVRRENAITAAATQAEPAQPRKPSPTKSSASSNDGAVPVGARQASLPERMSPQLATLLDSAPTDPQGWLYEIKFDGYRLMTRIDGPSVACFTRNSYDWTARLPALAEAVSRMNIGSGWLDGEVVVPSEHGVPDFGALQNAFDSGSTAGLVYYVFDLPYFDGLDLRKVQLAERREILRTLLAREPQDNIRFCEAFEHTPQDLLASAAKLGLEGVIGKRADSAYTSGRSRSWIKLKTQQRQEFVIGGYTEPNGARAGLGALLLGVHDAAGRLRYAGNVGTGFDDKTLTNLKARLASLHSTRNPFAEPPGEVKGQWVKPQLLVEVSFAAWTRAGRIRHAVFKGLRTDKPVSHISREAPAGNVLPSISGLRITHPERVIDPSTGFTKKDLIDYYANVAPLMLPHLKGRPASLVRAPAGIAGELFFQKHADARSMPGITLLDPALDPGHASLLEISSIAALLSAVQMNVVEFHTWNAKVRTLRKPDRMTFDLDPGEGVDWPEVQASAQLVRAMLDELGLASFLKTSGGKGLHVVVPLKPSNDFDTVKDFSHAMVDHLARVLPQRFVARSGPKNRIGKIFVDYLRNGWGATTVAAWSVRARPGLGVSVPVAWDELPSLTGGAHWKARALHGRLATGNQPWAGYETSRNLLRSAMKQLDFKPATQKFSDGKRP